MALSRSTPDEEGIPVRPPEAGKPLEEWTKRLFLRWLLKQLSTGVTQLQNYIALLLPADECDLTFLM
jgi:hypothetical protein